MAEDLLEKGAIVQRDKLTYAVAPHIPGGLITDFNLLRRIADVAEKYGAQAIKVTSAERFALEIKTRGPGRGLAGIGPDPRRRPGPVRSFHQNLPRHHLLPPGSPGRGGGGPPFG